VEVLLYVFGCRRRLLFLSPCRPQSTKSKNKLTKEEKEFCNNNPDLINLPKLLSAEEIIAQNEILKILGERE
jgi:hypothetical protein